MLLEYCIWRWKWSLCLLLFIPYWIAATYWDHMSAENRRKDPDEKHYSAWLLNTIFGVTVVYLVIRMYIKRFCRNVDGYGQDSRGFVRRPDL